MRLRDSGLPTAQREVLLPCVSAGGLSAAAKGCQVNGYAARADANQREIIDALRTVGAKVLSLHRLGAGVPDLLVDFGGRLFLIECKAGKHWKLTEAQKRFHATWRVKIVTSVEEALEVIGIRMP